MTDVSPTLGEPEDVTSAFDDHVRLVPNKLSYAMPITQEALEDAQGIPPLVEIMARPLEEQRAFNALPAEEQARIRAERQAKHEAEKAARSCEHCGCDPDGHGGY